MKFPIKTQVNSSLYAVKKLKNLLKEMDAARKAKELIMNINALLFKAKKRRYSPITISTCVGVENPLRCSDAIAAMSDTNSYRQQYSAIKPINYSVDAPSDQFSVSSYLQRIDEDPTISSREEEIDKLADAFIAGFRQQIKLEKQNSYRNYEDMLTRST